MPAPHLSDLLLNPGAWSDALMSTEDAGTLEHLLTSIPACEAVPEPVRAARVAQVLAKLGRHAEALARVSGYVDGLPYAQGTLITAQLKDQGGLLRVLAGPRRAHASGAGRHACGWEAQMRLEYGLACANEFLGHRREAEQHYDRALLLAEELNFQSLKLLILGARTAQEAAYVPPEVSDRQLRALLGAVREVGNRTLERNMTDRVASAYASRVTYGPLIGVACTFPADSPDAWMQGAARTLHAAGRVPPPDLGLAPAHPLMLLAHTSHGLQLAHRAARLFDHAAMRAECARLLALPSVTSTDWAVTVDGAETLRCIALLRLGEGQAAVRLLQTLISGAGGPSHLPQAQAHHAALALEVLATTGLYVRGLPPQHAALSVANALAACAPEAAAALSLQLVEHVPTVAGVVAHLHAPPALVAALRARAVIVTRDGATYRGVPVPRYPASAAALAALEDAVYGREAGGDNSATQVRRRHREALAALSDDTGTPSVLWQFRVEATLERLQLHDPALSTAMDRLALFSGPANHLGPSLEIQ